MEYEVSFKRAEMEAAQASVGVRWHAMEWALDFAQAPLDDLFPDEIEAYTNGLIALVTYSARLGLVYGAQEVGRIPMEVTLQEAQVVMQQIFRPLIVEGRVTLPAGQTLTLSPDGRRYVEATREYAINQENIQAGLVYLLSHLSEWRRTLRSCPALYMKPRRRCLRWFLARSVQRFCSTACQQRAHAQERHLSHSLAR